MATTPQYITDIRAAVKPNTSSIVTPTSSNTFVGTLADYAAKTGTTVSQSTLERSGSSYTIDPNKTAGENLIALREKVKPLEPTQSIVVVNKVPYHASSGKSSAAAKEITATSVDAAPTLPVKDVAVPYVYPNLYPPSTSLSINTQRPTYVPTIGTTSQTISYNAGTKIYDTPLSKPQSTYTAYKPEDKARDIENKLAYKAEMSQGVIPSLGYAAAGFGVGAFVGARDVVLHPIKTATGTVTTTAKLAVPALDQGQAREQLAQQITLNPAGFAGELVGSGVATGGMIKGIKYVSPVGVKIKGGFEVSKKTPDIYNDIKSSIAKLDKFDETAFIDVFKPDLMNYVAPKTETIPLVSSGGKSTVQFDSSRFIINPDGSFTKINVATDTGPIIVRNVRSDSGIVGDVRMGKPEVSGYYKTSEGTYRNVDKGTQLRLGQEFGVQPTKFEVRDIKTGNVYEVPETAFSKDLTMIDLNKGKILYENPEAVGFKTSLEPTDIKDVQIISQKSYKGEPYIEERQFFPTREISNFEGFIEPEVKNPNQYRIKQWELNKKIEIATERTIEQPKITSQPEIKSKLPRDYGYMGGPAKQKYMVVEEPMTQTVAIPDQMQTVFVEPRTVFVASERQYVRELPKFKSEVSVSPKLGFYPALSTRQGIKTKSLTSEREIADQYIRQRSPQVTIKKTPTIQEIIAESAVKQKTTPDQIIEQAKKQIQEQKINQITSLKSDQRYSFDQPIPNVPDTQLFPVFAFGPSIGPSGMIPPLSGRRDSTTTMTFGSGRYRAGTFTNKVYIPESMARKIIAQRAVSKGMKLGPTNAQIGQKMFPNKKKSLRGLI